MNFFADSAIQGKDLPYCTVWISSRSGKPNVIGSSLSGTGIFKKNDPAERSTISVTVNMEANKPNTLDISVLDVTGLLEAGIHAGVRISVLMGYLGKGFGEPLSKMVFLGVMQVPNVKFGSDGTIQLTIKANDNTDVMGYVKQTRTFTKMTRNAIVLKVLEKYSANENIGVPYIMFDSMYTVEPRIDQTRQSDLEFLYYLAAKWQCVFDTRTDDKKLLSVCYFVNGDASGGAKIGSMDSSLLGKGAVYKMDWRSGLQNVRSLNFSGDASGAKGPGGILERKDGKKLEVVATKIGGSTDEQDPSNWDLDSTKVDKWLKANNGKTIDDFKILAFALPQSERHKLFYNKKPAPMAGSPPSPVTSAGLGTGGYTVDFELPYGDPFLAPNTPVSLGGDVYSMFKSKAGFNKSAGAGAVASAAEAKKGQFKMSDVRESYKGDVLYWRTQSITHTFSSSGFITKGKMVR